MTICFYSWPQSSGSGARWALEEFELEINPFGKVPALGDATWYVVAANNRRR
jgi:hypothetical protein